MDQEKLRAFLDELTEISHKHGLGGFALKVSFASKPGGLPQKSE